MRLAEFDYHLPETLIAQQPVEPRDRSRLMVVDRATGELGHHYFEDLADLLRPGDLVVANDARVVPAKLRGIRVATGARVELLLVRREAAGTFDALARPGRRIRPGDRLIFGEGRLGATVESASGRERRIVFDGDGPHVAELLEELGEAPLPPYIRRRKRDPHDRERYQTVYARHPGAVAAPTAGLHFTEALRARLSRLGVEMVFVTLQVGWGTFEPVRTSHVEDHRVTAEGYRIEADALAAVASARREGRRVVAVGTTTVRVLESLSDGALAEGTPVTGTTSLFVHPPFRFRHVDALITNFHLPRSSLLMLAAAFMAPVSWRAPYAEAIERGYRFYSYGDAMLVR